MRPKSRSSQELTEGLGEDYIAEPSDSHDTQYGIITEGTQNSINMTSTDHHNLGVPVGNSDSPDLTSRTTNMQENAEEINAH